MKVLTVFAILFFTTLIGLLFYAHYDTKKFIESLPQAPALQHEVAPAEKNAKTTRKADCRKRYRTALRGYRACSRHPRHFS